MRHKSFACEHPELLKEWDYSKNELIGIRPEAVTSGSGKKAHWKCSVCGYEWEAQITARSSGRGCPVCSHEKVWSGHNDLATIYPEIAKYFDAEKSGISASEIMPNTAKKYWWKCEKGHSYPASPNTKVNMKTGCPVCSGHRLLTGYNDFQTLYPEIAKEWDYSKNGDLKPESINPGSKKIVYWICDKGHSYEAQIANRVKGTGCPYCSVPAKKILVGFNDFASTNKELLKEWDYSKNEKGPESYLPGSNQRVNWRCSVCGNEWKAKIVDRVKGTGCPKCARIFHTSKAEQIVYYYVHIVFPDAINGYRTPEGDEVDIFIPSLELGIEYDGERWHSTDMKNEADQTKGKRIISNGIALIRIREPHCQEISDGSYIITTPKPNADWTYLGPTIKDLINTINTLYVTAIEVDIDITKDLPKAFELFQNTSVRGSIATDSPGLAKEWDYEKNSPLKPENVPAHSALRAWWICNTCGYSWSAVVASRTDGKGCPNCGRIRSNKAKHKKIRAIETGKVFESVKEAAKCLGNETYMHNIANCAKGRRKTAYGYHWEYVDGREDSPE